MTHQKGQARGDHGGTRARECNQPLRLVEPRNGGALLIYECPVCGGRVARTREQAEAEAQAKTSEVPPPSPE